MTQLLGHEKLIVYLGRCSQRSQRPQPMTLNTLTRQLYRTLNRRPYSDTLNRSSNIANRISRITITDYDSF